MKKSLLILQSILVLINIACIIFCSIKVTSCNGREENVDINKEDIVAVYNAYVSDAESNGITPLDFEAWLNSLKGEDGQDGNGIVSISKTNIDGLVDTYTIIFTNGTTTTFTITNGEKGEQGTAGQNGVDGVGISDIKIENGKLYVKYTNSSSYVELGQVKGADGQDGKDGQDLTACEHDFNDWDIQIEANCYLIGYSTRTCKKCGEIEYQFTQATEHKWKYYQAIKEVDCENDGLSYYTCEICGMIKIAATKTEGHDFDEVSYVWSDDYSTCTATRICKRDSNHVENEIVNTTSTIKQQKTCVLKEITTYTADFKNTAFNKQEKDVETAQALRHNISDAWVIDVAPTDLEFGSKSHHCTRCEEKFDVTQISMGSLIVTQNGKHLYCNRC